MARKNTCILPLLEFLYESDTVEEFKPRKHQEELMSVWKDTDDYIGICWGRRGGKDYLTFKLIVDQCLENPNSRIAYFFPTIGQGKNAIYDGVTKKGDPWLPSLLSKADVITPRSNGKLYHSDNTIRFKNGSIIRILGADKAETKVGKHMCSL